MSEKTLKISEKAIVTLLILVVIPMLLVAIYARPFADDFGYSARTHQVWENTHSVIRLLAAVFTEVKDVYFDWQGSFSALALFALQPSVFGARIYGLSTFILMAFFLYGNYYFFKRVFNADRHVAVIVFASVVILSTQTLPHAFQGFYWWNGACYYTLFYSLMLIQLGMLIYEKKVIAPCILGFILGGGNLVSGLLGLEITALILLREAFNFFKGKNLDEAGKKRNFAGLSRVILIMLFSVIGFAINAIAPGNAIRALETPRQTPVEAVANSFLEAYGFFNEWLDLPLVILLAFLLPFLWHYAGVRKLEELKDSAEMNLPLAFYMILVFCLFASTFTPTMYAMSEVGPRRIQNIRYFMLIVFLVLLEMEAVIRTRNLLKKRLLPVSGKESLERYLIAYMLVVLGGICVVLAVNTIPKENRYNLTTIASVRTLLIGEARKYAKARDEWTQILESDEKTVTLPAIHDHPVPIYYSEFDITGNPDDYRDQSMCKYYGKDMIILEQE